MESKTLHFEAELRSIRDWRIIRLPLEISEQLPSRGMVMADVCIKGETVLLPLEPDGKFSHWLKLEESFCSLLSLEPGDSVNVSLTPASEWSEPDVPADILAALQEQHLESEWNSLTVKARWEWIRWIQSTNIELTRQKHITVACSKLSSGKRRPCCFDTSRCTVPYVSKSGVLDLPLDE